VSIRIPYEITPPSWGSTSVFHAHGLYVSYGGGATIDYEGIVTIIQIEDIDVTIMGADVLRKRIDSYIRKAQEILISNPSGFVDQDELDKKIPREISDPIRAIALEIFFDHLKKSPETFSEFIKGIREAAVHAGREHQAGEMRKVLGISDAVLLPRASENS